MHQDGTDYGMKLLVLMFEELMQFLLCEDPFWGIEHLHTVNYLSVQQILTSILHHIAATAATPDKSCHDLESIYSY